MFGISHAVQMKRSSACKVIVEVLVLRLLVVVKNVSCEYDHVNG